METEEAFRYLYLIMEREKARPRAFNIGHLMLSVIFLTEANRVSRGQMQSRLGLGAGSTRSLMSHLALNHIASASPVGFQIRQLGKEIGEAILRVVRGPYPITVEYLRLDRSQVLYLLTPVKPNLVNPIGFRDLIVRYGGTGATVCSIIQQKVIVMVLEDQLSKYSENDEREIMKYRPNDGAIACVISAPSEQVAASSGAAAIFNVMLPAPVDALI